MLMPVLGIKYPLMLLQVFKVDWPKYERARDVLLKYLHIVLGIENIKILGFSGSQDLGEGLIGNAVLVHLLLLAFLCWSLLLCSCRQSNLFPLLLKLEQVFLHLGDRLLLVL